MKTARLFVVATPIGNLGDISSRALDTLRDVSVIACEDTRRIKQLLRLIEVSVKKKELIVLNAIDEEIGTRSTLQRLSQGIDVALVCDAGTPLLSDPGFELVREAHEQKITVVPISGPSALTTVLSVCPLPLNEFVFVGFLKRKGAEKRRQLRVVARSSVSTIFFESPARLVETLQMLVEEGVGCRSIFVGRELTKLHEQLSLGSVSDVLLEYEATPVVKGELVIVLDRNPQNEFSTEFEELAQELSARLKPSEAAQVLRNLTNVDRDAAYTRILEIRSQKNKIT